MSISIPCRNSEMLRSNNLRHDKIHQNQRDKNSYLRSNENKNKILQIQL